MLAAKWAPILIGVILIAVGVGMQAGVVPSATLVGCGGSTQGCQGPSITAKATYTTSGLTVTLKDESTWSGSIVDLSMNVTWGDGQGTYPVALHSTLTHTYALAGTYKVGDSVFGVGGTSEYRSSDTLTVKVSAGTTSSGNGTGNSTGSSGCNGPGGVNLCVSFTPRPFSVAPAGNLSISLTDQSTGSYVTVVSDVWSFGDGQTDTTYSLGATVVHIYPFYGNYTVTETLSVVAQSNDPQSWNVSFSKNVSFEPTGCSGCNQPPSPPTSAPPPAVSAVGVILMLAGAAAIAVAVLPGVYRVGVPAALALAAAAVGIFALATGAL